MLKVKRYMGTVLTGVIVFLITIGFLGCQNPAEKDPDVYTVVTTVFPLFDMLQNLKTKDFTLDFVFPPGANPHTYEPSPSSVAVLGQADLFIGIHPEFDGWPAGFLTKTTKIVWLFDKSGMTHEDGHDHELHNHEAFDQESHINPHIWLSLPSARALCKTMAQQLYSLSKDEEIWTHLERYDSALQDLHEQCRLLFEPLKGASFFQWHPAWDYFAEDYGLNVAGTVTYGHGDEPPLKHFQALLHHAESENVRLLIAEKHVSNKTINTFIKASKAALIRLDAIGNPADQTVSTYLRLMQTNAGKIASALNSIQ